MRSKPRLGNIAARNAWNEQEPENGAGCARQLYGTTPMERQTHKPTNTAANVVMAYIKPEDTRHWYQAFTQHGVKANLLLREPEVMVRLSENPPDLILLDSRLYHLRSLATVSAIVSEAKLRSTAVHVIVSRQAPGIHEQYWSAGAVGCHDCEGDKAWTARQMLAGAAFVRRLLRRDEAVQQTDYTSHILASLLQLLQENEFKLPQAKKLRNLLGADVAELQHMVRKRYGTTLGRWIHNEKMSYAAQLLGASRYTIGEIADMLGYSSAANFSTAFRICHESTPRTYRQTHASIPLKRCSVHDP